jgi:hypothetical protein
MVVELCLFATEPNILTYITVYKIIKIKWSALFSSAFWSATAGAAASCIHLVLGTH